MAHLLSTTFVHPCWIESIAVLGMRRMCGYFGVFIRLVVGHPTDRLAFSTRAGADYNSTSKGAAASCG